jgi:hypothetical protein
VNDATIWTQIRAAGPQGESTGFDPYRTDDVLAAERATLQYDRRKSFVASYAWAIPSPAAVECIANAVGPRRLLEVCAGSGLWASLLAAQGVKVVATDLGQPAVLHYEVERLDAETAVKQHRECAALMLIWPPFKNDCAYQAVRAFEGDLLVFVGDERFTANDRFFARLARDWLQVDQLNLESWPGTRDAVHVYKRRNSSMSSSCLQDAQQRSTRQEGQSGRGECAP